LQLPSPTTQIRLLGEGTLFAIRVPEGPNAQLVPLTMVVPPVKLENTPRPEPPLWAWIENLQKATPPPVSNAAPKEVAPRHALGFRIHWIPPICGGLTEWPQDLSGRPPLDASIFQIEHSQVSAPGPGGAPGRRKWEPLLPADNWFMGSRDQRLPKGRLTFNGNVMQWYPEGPEPHQGLTQLAFEWRHAFEADIKAGKTARPKPVPEPGSYHQYRVRSVDLIGRPSNRWCDTTVERLEKRIPPPVPVGPDDVGVANRIDSGVPEPAGVHARVYVQAAPDLTQADKTMWGGASNVILLRWGWHDEQRKQDPFAREFRVYLGKQLDRMNGVVLGAAPLSIPGAVGQSYQVMLTLERTVAKDDLAGSTLPTGYPFYIKSHTAAQAGQPVSAVVETLVPVNGAYKVPALGAVQLAAPVGSQTTRPPMWSKREAVVPITAQEQYEYAFTDALNLTADNPEDCVWVGVSAADDQFYVDDQLAPAENRPGNESAIVPAIASGRYHGRPQFDVPPPLADVPVLRTPEPANRPLSFSLDLTPYLAGTSLASKDRIRPERASVEVVFAAYRVEDGKILARVLEPKQTGDAEKEITIAETGKQENPADRASVIAALTCYATTALENRFLVFLAGSHPYPDRLFQSAVEKPFAFGAFGETLPPKPSRWVYRVRKSDAAGHLSTGGAMAKVVVRVPSLAPGAAPEKASAAAGDPSGTLRLRVIHDPEVTHLLSFSQGASRALGPPEEAQVLRIPNSETLYSSGAGILLRAPDGSILTPTSKALTDADVTADPSAPETFRCVKLGISGAAGARVRVWACTLTLDGVPSVPAGPWAVELPAAALPSPTLIATQTAGQIQFSWTWPSSPPPACAVGVDEQQSDQTWKRISAVLPESVSSFTCTAPSGSRNYRLSGTSPDGRSIQSNTVTP
jgi:hypothetical protein